MGIIDFFKDLRARHQALKERIHKTRIPLSAKGQKAMGLVYFCIPLVIGKFVFDWTVEKSQEKWKIDEKTGEVILPKQLVERKEETERNAQQARLVMEQVFKEAREQQWKQ